MENGDYESTPKHHSSTSNNASIKPKKSWNIAYTTELYMYNTQIKPLENVDMNVFQIDLVAHSKCGWYH